MNVAAFISPHGYGHGARCAGVMSAMQEIDPSIGFEIYTTVPRWFFDESLTGPFAYHRVATDIGLVQKGPFVQDIDETILQLNNFIPFRPGIVDALAENIAKSACRLVLCDISPLGITVAEAADVPSVLIENFTWDWIYEPYAVQHPEIARHAAYLRAVFETADHHIQAEPVCRMMDGAFCAGPIARKPRTRGTVVKQQLEIPATARVVLVTLGGIVADHPFPKRPAIDDDVFVLMPGASDSVERTGNVLRMPHRSGHYHPDLIHASDAVIGKAGYSTVAEAYHAGVPFGYISREGFRETSFLEAFIRTSMQGMSFSWRQFQSGQWLERLPALLELPVAPVDAPNGADAASAFIHRIAVEAQT